jgi:hypothetical protein
MKNHTKVYLKGNGLRHHRLDSCEVCGAKAVDIHHIEAEEWAAASTQTRLRTLWRYVGNVT